ncbi:MAG: hypothetical protein ABR974_04975 [Bacteroidales bacterium]|jgi:hypothetical protein
MSKINLAIIFLYIITIALYGQISSQLIQTSKKDSAKFGVIESDSSSDIRSINEFVKFNQQNPAEKIFLHLDRHNYMQGDTIWFKAYLWYVYDQVPDTVSGILYVELINATGKISLKRKLLIQNGTSYGDFCIDTAISPGRYTLRAYTRLMQNLKDGEPFYQTVSINPTNQNFQFECIPTIIKQSGNDSLKVSMRFFEINNLGNLNINYKHKASYSLKIGNHQLQLDSVLLVNSDEHALKYSLTGISKHDSLADFEVSFHDDKVTFKKQFQIPIQENIDLQFFPEGGNLVNGLVSKVAFKAIGMDGLGREVTGEIETDDETIVTGFKSTYKGMGFFMLKPQAKKEYIAHFWYNNQKYIVPLPKVLEEGSVMTMNFAGNSKDQFLSIKQITSGVITSKYVIGSSYGKIWFSALIKAFTDSCKLKIPLELLPEGICRLTILNNSFEPECERLIYVDKNQRFNIKVIPDSSSYGIRSKMTLIIIATGPGKTPVKTDLSLSVIDKEQNPKDTEVHSISAYKLLESELRGYIEDADSYFKNDSCTNKDALDLLLLTQGYRKFLMNNSNPDEPKFSPEKSIDISGKIALNGSKSHEKKFNYREIGLTLISVSKNPYIGVSHPDSLGKFRFQIPLMLGKPHLFLQSTSPKNKPFNGQIILDKTILPPEFITSLPVQNNILSPAIEYISRIQTVKKTEISKNHLYGPMSKTLPEVVVTAKVEPKNWWRHPDKDAIKIVDLDSLDPGGDRYRSFNDLMVQEFGARYYNDANANLFTVLLPCIKIISLGWNVSYWFPIYLVNGEKYWNGEGFDFSKLSTLSNLPVNEIKKILIIPPMKSIAMYYAYEPIVGFPQFISQSLVMIETYSKNTYRGDPVGAKTIFLDGLDVPRVFYSPRYEGPLRNSPVYDGRATLYWEPSIKTDSDGQAKVDFYTSDRKTGLEVFVKGIEIGSGYPGEGDSQIKMKFK